MDKDITMSEDYESTYPAPGSEPSTPYPALAQNASTPPQRRASLPFGGFSFHGGFAQPAADTGRGYMSLAEYFEKNRNQQAHAYSIPSLPDDEDDEEGQSEGDEDGEDGEEEEDEAVDAQRPQTTGSPGSLQEAQPALPPHEDVWTSLPGVHHLPDDDFMEASSYKGWPDRVQPPAPQPDPNSRGDGQRGRGRPRGRPRGPRGWKWALKGTEHENMFQSPRVTAESAGTKRKGPRGRGSRGPRRAGRGGRRTTSTRDIDPGERFKELQAQATTAFIDNDLDTALELSLQAVTENAEVPAAHILIDQVLTAQGRHEDALHAHWTATWASRNSETWLAHAERINQLRGDEKSKEDYDKIFQCYIQALKLDKNNYDIRIKKVDLFVDMKAYKHAFRECRSMLKLKPGDTETLWKLAELLKLTREIKESRTSREERAPRVVDAYKAAFHTWRAEPVFGDEEMQWTHLDTYIGLLEEIATPPGDSLRELKQLARWFLGRGHEIFWDSLNDDREYDLGFERRVQTEFWQARMFTLDDARYGKGLPLWLRAKMGCLRAKMGFVYREEALRHFDVLLTQPNAAEDNPETFMATAEQLSALYWYQDAAKFYEAAKDQEHEEDIRFYLGMARCYRNLSRVHEAEKALQSVLELDKDNLQALTELARLYAESGQKAEAAKVARTITRVGRENIIRSEKLLLSKAAERNLAPAPPKEGRSALTNGPLSADPAQSLGGDAGEALQHDGHEQTEDVNTDDGSSDDETESLSTSVGPKKTRRPKATSRSAHQQDLRRLQEQRSRVQASYEMVRKLWPFLEHEGNENEEAARQWMEHAAAMADEFTSTKVFYPTKSSDRFVGLLAGKNAEIRSVIEEMEALRKQMRGGSMKTGEDPEALPSVDDRSSGDFHDISFQEWHRVLAELALQYARFADEEKCISLIDALTYGNVFRHDFALYNTTLALSIYCAIVFNDREMFLDASRQYLYQSDYRSGMAYQVFAAAGGMGYGEDPFEIDSGKMQAWTSKLVKLHDVLVMDPEMRDKWEWTGLDNAKEQRHLRLGKVDDGLIPGLLTTYAHVVTSKRRVHSSPALAYLFRTLALQPDEVVVNLSIAVNFIIDSLRRSEWDKSSLDRQATIQQGLGFFYRYYNARVATARKRYIQEAEYNAARIWSLLGWTHLAAKGYEKVLKLSPQVREEAKREGEEVEDVASEAAFALQRIFVAAENEDAARAIGEEWLTM